MNIDSEKFLIALQQERRYLAKELHDGVAQTTLQLGLQIGICSKILEQGRYEMLETELTNLEERIQLASRQIREMISDMRPPLIEDDANLIDYLKASIEIHTQRGGPAVSFNVDRAKTDFRVSPIEKLALTQVVQEALLNIRKHADATEVKLAFWTKNDTTYLVITDNGRGIMVNGTGNHPKIKVGAGLENMKARLEALGGSLTIERNPEGSGTQLIARLPK